MPASGPWVIAMIVARPPDRGSASATRRVQARAHVTCLVASAFAQQQPSPELARDDRFGLPGASELTIGLPRPHLSRRGRGPAASPRRCTGRAARSQPDPRTIASPRVGVPSDPDRASGLGHPRDRLAESNRRRCELLTTPLPRTQPSCRGRPDDCMARMMRKSNRARSTSDAALSLP